jgi:S-adenosylmethionine synthetase
MHSKLSASHNQKRFFQILIFHAMYTTTESVTIGHPDKICDQISDAIVDAYLANDPDSRVAVNCMGAHGTLFIGGEVTSRGQVDHSQIARDLYKDIGYDDELKINVNVVPQSPDIALGVDTGGAGDQGIMYGFATNATPAMLPEPVVLAHALTRGLTELRVQSGFEWLKPDGKAQVTFKGAELKTVLISCQHAENFSQQEIEKRLRKHLLEPLLGDLKNLEILVNPTGRFVRGGFFADTGLTGRKIMVDTYGGLILHGGGAFSGKDPSKVDRSAAYFCRFVARQLVKRGLSKQALVKVAYAIGRAEPLMVEVEGEHNGGLTELVKQEFDFRPQAMIERLDLKRPIYRKTAMNGHFGNPEFPWEV